MAVLYEDGRIATTKGYPLYFRSATSGSLPRHPRSISALGADGALSDWGPETHVTGSTSIRPAPEKRGVVIDKGDRVKAVLTPDDPERVLNILEDKVRRGGTGGAA